jgi:peroxiredoxin
MARPGRLARRLARLTRQPGLKSPLIARPRGTLIATVVLMLAVCCGLLYPVRGEQPHPSPANDKSAAQSKPALPIEQLVTLQDAETGKPLRNTTVRLQRQRFQTAARLLQSVGETFELRTDGEGKLRIEFDELSQLDAQQTAMIDLAIDGYAGLYVVAPALEDIDQLEPTKEYCHASTPFSTRVFEPDGQPANHACVFLEARVEGKGWFYFTSSDEQGHLRCQVPREQSIGLTISSAQGAPTRLVVSGGVATVPDIHLRRGAVVSGQLLDREGHPLPGRTIVMAAEDSQAVQGELEIAAHGDSIGLELHRRTDADGKFRFGPMLGDVQVYLERNDDAPQGELLLPAYLELSAGGDQWLPLMVAPTGELRGTLRTSEGTPVADQAVSVVLLPHRSNSYFTLCTVRTDVEGKYALRVPFPLSRAIVNIDEQWTADGMRRVARAANSTLEVAGRYLLEQYVGQPMTIDWIVTTEDGDAPRVKPANRPVAADMQPLANLEAEIKSAWSAYEQARDAAETDEQRSEIQETQDPFDRLVARCLEFEAQHRGTRVAIGALYYVMQAGASSLSPKINAAREQAVDTLREHYVDHPDVDLLLTQFTSGAGVANSEPLLLALADRSPFDYVRATAMLELAEARFTTVRWAEAFKASPPMPAEQEQALIDAQESPSTREMLKTNFENMRRFRAALEKVNADELRNSAVDLLDRVTSNYPDTEAPLRQWLNRQGEHDHPALHLVERTDKWRTPTPAQRAEILRFQHTRLRVGLIAPEIEGLDFEQRPVRLSQFRGKVVLVTFTRGNVENELYAQCQVLQQALAGRPFTCLSVIPGGANGGFSARSIAKDGGVTWPVLRDSHDDILSQRWCQVTFPEAYLIGPDGKIVYHHSPARDVDRLRPMIERLLGDADEKLADQKP